MCGERGNKGVIIKMGGWFVFFFKQKTAYEIGTGDWSSDVCSSDLIVVYTQVCKGGEFENGLYFVLRLLFHCIVFCLT